MVISYFYSGRRNTLWLVFICSIVVCRRPLQTYSLGRKMNCVEYPILGLFIFNMLEIRSLIRINPVFGEVRPCCRHDNIGHLGLFGIQVIFTVGGYTVDAIWIWQFVDLLQMRFFFLLSNFGSYTDNPYLVNIYLFRISKLLRYSFGASSEKGMKLKCNELSECFFFFCQSKQYGTKWAITTSMQISVYSTCLKIISSCTMQCVHASIQSIRFLRIDAQEILHRKCIFIFGQFA